MDLSFSSFYALYLYTFNVVVKESKKFSIRSSKVLLKDIMYLIIAFFCENLISYSQL